MNNRIQNSAIVLFLTFFTIISACKNKNADYDGSVTVRIMSDPDNLNPMNSGSVSAAIVSEFIFGQINSSEVDGNFKLLPFLTNSLGQVSEITEGEWTGGMRIDYEFRPEAKWDNGTPVTADDYIFTMKTILNPKTNTGGLKTNFEYIGDIVKDSLNPRKFTVFSNKKYFKIEEFAGSFILPEYNFDPENLMRTFTVRDLNTPAKRENLKSNPVINKFADEFNSEKFSREPKYLTGIGPYKLEKWITGQEIVLRRKDTWWGDQFSHQRQFAAYPKIIRFKIINDKATAIAALRDKKLDALDNITAKDFQELESNEEFKKAFKTENKDHFVFSYIALNMRNPKLNDIRVRKALAHAINRDKINQTVFLGEMRKTESFVHPLQFTYNKGILPFNYDINIANQYLDEAGWRDTDGDGIRDKNIDGKNTPLSLEIKLNQGNESRKNTALVIQEELKKIGVAVSITAKENSVLIEELDKLDFEMNINAFTISPRISDPKQIWHIENSKVGGDNKTGWGNAESDKMIDDMIQELDPEKRQESYLKLQQMIHDDVPFIYMFAGRNRLAINRKFAVPTTMIAPGYYLGDFKLAEEE